MKHCRKVSYCEEPYWLCYEQSLPLTQPHVCSVKIQASHIHTPQVFKYVATVMTQIGGDRKKRWISSILGANLFSPLLTLYLSSLLFFCPSPHFLFFLKFFPFLSLLQLTSSYAIFLHPLITFLTHTVNDGCNRVIFCLLCHQSHRQSDFMSLTVRVKVWEMSSEW